MIEVHENPECATSDGMQSLYFKDFETNKTAEMSKEMVKPAEITMNI